MFRRPIKEIHGTVFVDSDFDGQRQASDAGIKDIGVSLFFVESKRVEKGDGPENDIVILHERLVAKTMTNEKGQYSFFAGPGMYSVCLDVASLPEGIGVLETNRWVEEDVRGSIDFMVRKAASIGLDTQLPGSMPIDGELTLTPVVKDERGNRIFANVSFLSDHREIDIQQGTLRFKPYSLQDGQIRITVKTGAVRKQFAIDMFIPRVCSVDKINLAYQKGILNDHYRAQNLLYAIRDKKKLPAEYRSKLPVKCATRLVDEIRKYAARPDAEKEIADEALRFLGSPVPSLDRVYRSPGGFFSIHYTLNGENAVTLRSRNPGAVPTYIEEIGLAFDRAKSITCDERGFRTPVFDQGRDSMDVYVYDLQGVYGITFASQYFSSAALRARVASSFICIDNNYSVEKGFDKNRGDCMKVTVAHEFFHAVQNAYNVDADMWWKEATATWNEDEVYNGINDYIRYLDRFFSSPHKSLDENTYSGVVFAKYLSESFGGYSIIKRIWEKQAAAHNNSLNAIDRTLQEQYKSQDIGTVFNKFTTWNYNPAQYYKDGLQWNTEVALQNTYTSYPIASVFGRLDHLSSHYQLFKSGDFTEAKSLRIAVEGTNRARWGFKLQKRNKGDTKCQVIEITSSGTMNRAEVVFKNFSAQYEEVCLIPANLEKEGDHLAYSYSADEL